MFWSRISDSSRVFITWLNSETVMVGGGFILIKLTLCISLLSLLFYGTSGLVGCQIIVFFLVYFGQTLNVNVGFTVTFFGIALRLII